MEMFTQFFIASIVIGVVLGHGRLLEPPSRASAWRCGFDTPVDYNDNEAFCGGFNHQYAVNDGKCGICGDAWDANPRQHEVGGLYATGTLVRTYTEGQTICVTADVTTNHLGYFEFKICPNNNVLIEATQECLDAFPLAKTNGELKHYIGSLGGNHSLQLQLPTDLTCSQCVLQWRYMTGNTWGPCEDGSSALGCGPQEEFRACADVVIDSAINSGVQHQNQPNQPFQPSHPSQPIQPSQQNQLNKPNHPKPEQPTQPNQLNQPNRNCQPVGIWSRISSMIKWCDLNCNHIPTFCPVSHCRCD